MKKIIMMLMFAAMLTGFSATAQSFDQDQVIFVVFHYENGIYNGRSEQELAAYEADWYKDRPRYEGRFFEGFSEQQSLTDKIPLVRTEEQLAQIDAITAPVLRIHIIAVDKKGNTRAKAVYENPQAPNTNETIVFNSKGGTFGTWLNLFGDGMERMGRQTAQWVREKL